MAGARSRRVEGISVEAQNAYWSRVEASTGDRVVAPSVEHDSAAVGVGMTLAIVLDPAATRAEGWPFMSAGVPVVSVERSALSRVRNQRSEGALMALALASVLRSMSRAQVGRAARGLRPVGLAVPAAAVIVAGLVLLAVVVDRALQVSIRRDEARENRILNAAGDAFAARVAERQRTGVMPPAGPAETAAAELIRARAERERRSLGSEIGGAVSSVAKLAIGAYLVKEVLISRE